MQVSRGAGAPARNQAGGDKLLIVSYFDEHYGYLTDQVRLAAYRRAVSAVVRPGMTVVDLGCGSGILGVLCLQAGAARVFAIDSTSMIEAARLAYGEAGFADRVTCIRGMSSMVALPETADLVICDQVGHFGFDAGIVEYLEDARRRFLKPDGVIVPRRLRLELAGVESARCYEQVSRWRVDAVPLEFRPLARFAENAKHPVTLAPGELLTAPAALGEIDLRQDTPDFHSWPAEFAIERDGVLHGLAGWFQCELAEDVWMTNSPLAEAPIQRSQAFLPLAEPLAVRSGDTVTGTVMARAKENFLAWVVGADGRRQRQSTLNSLLIGEQDLRSGDPGAIPRLSPEGEARRLILSYCDGVRTMAEIETVILNEHPDLLPSRQALADFVTRVLARDSELT